MNVKLDVLDALSEFARNLRNECISVEIIDIEKKILADYYSACFAGYRINYDFNCAIKKIISDAAKPGKSTFFFSSDKVDVVTAAYMNAIYSHGADIDDGNMKAMGHIATHVLSAVCAIAEERESLWSDVFAAINIGYEVFNRISASVQPGHVRRGFHSTGTVGAIAVGAACAKLMNLDENGIYNSMSMAALQSGGLFIITESGQCCKPLNPANAVRVGILSAKLAEQGINGPRKVMESPKGWFRAMTDSVDYNSIIEGLGKVYTISESYLKLYPTCRHTHGAIDAALGIRKQIFGQDIHRIEIYTYRNAISTVGGIRIPKNSEEAKFSIFYAVANALVNGRFLVDDLNVDDISDEKINLINMMTLIEDDSLEQLEKGIRGARVVVFCDGSKIENTVTIPKGEPGNPLTWNDIENKMISCAKGVIAADRCNDMIGYIRNIESTKMFVHPKTMTEV